MIYNLGSFHDKDLVEINSRTVLIETLKHNFHFDKKLEIGQTDHGSDSCGSENIL